MPGGGGEEGKREKEREKKNLKEKGLDTKKIGFPLEKKKEMRKEVP